MKIHEIYERKWKEPSDINEHFPVLQYYASLSDSVTEFGVRTVVSTWALIAGQPDRLTSYDLQSPGDQVLEYVRQVAEEAMVEFDFIAANVRDIEIEPTDTLFIDTFHTYGQLQIELAKHASKVRKWIILHDTETFGEKGEAGSEKGLNYAIREFVHPANPWEIKEVLTNNNGLTVLQRK